MIQCKHCLVILPEEANFCVVCGLKVEKEIEQPIAEAPPPEVHEEPEEPEAVETEEPEEPEVVEAEEPEEPEVVEVEEPEELAEVEVEAVEEAEEPVAEAVEDLEAQIAEALEELNAPKKKPCALVACLAVAGLTWWLLSRKRKK